LKQVGFLTALLLGLLFAAGSAQANIMDNIGNTFQSAAGGWSGALFGIAKGLFLKLALLEILWFGLIFVIEKDDPRTFLVSLLKKIMALLFFYAILLNFDSWIPAIINGFSEAGSTAGGTGTLTPSAVMERGMTISSGILEKAKELDWTQVGPFLLAALVAIFVLLTFAVIAGQMLVTLIEGYIVISAGVLFLGFAGSRWTTTFAEKFISFAVSNGVKLFVTYLIIGAGQNLSDNWLSIIQSAPDVSGYFEVMAGAMVYMFLAWQIPALASSMLTGSVQMTLGGAAATAGAVAGAGIGAAGLGAAASAGTVGAGVGIGGLTKAAIDNARAGGASGTLGVAAGAIGAASNAIGASVSDGIKGLGSASIPGGLAERVKNNTASTQEATAGKSVSAPSVPGAATGPSAPSTAASAGAPGAPGGTGSSGVGVASSGPQTPIQGGSSGGQAVPSSGQGPSGQLQPGQGGSSAAQGGTQGTASNVASNQAGSASGALSEGNSGSSQLGSSQPGGANDPASAAAPQNRGSQTKEQGLEPARAETSPQKSSGQPAAQGNKQTTEQTKGNGQEAAPAQTNSGAETVSIAEAITSGASEASSMTIGSSSTNVDAPVSSAQVDKLSEQSANQGSQENQGLADSQTGRTGSSATKIETAQSSGESAQPDSSIKPPVSSLDSEGKPIKSSDWSDPRDVKPGAGKPSMGERLAEGAQMLGELPNDSAAGAGVQINLKTDE
jgi:type IV secretion system protein TrbL